MDVIQGKQVGQLRHAAEQLNHICEDKKNRAGLTCLPDELLERVADQLQEQLWPPVDSIITDWNNYPSPKSQRDLCAFSQACRALNRIAAPRLFQHIVHDFEDNSSNQTSFYYSEYEWLSHESFPWQFSPRWIRVLYLHDLFHYLDAPVEMKSMIQCLKRLSGSLEVIVAKGYCASVLLHTLTALPVEEMVSLKVLKLYSHTVSVQSIFAAFRVFPNLESLTLDFVNIEGSDVVSSQVSASRFPPISQLDLCTRLYSREEYEALTQIFKALAPTLKVVHIHGEYSEDLDSIFSILKTAPIETLLLNFRNRFPVGLMAIRIPTLKTLSISTYAYTSVKLWESELVGPVSRIIIRASGYPLDIRQSDERIKLSNLTLLELQSLCKIRDHEEERNWDSTMRNWCSKKGITFINKNSESNIISPQDDYHYL